MSRRTKNLWTVCLFIILDIGIINSRRSPNSDYITIFRKTTFGAKYSRDVIEDAMLDTPGLVRKYKYPIEVHRVLTDDGYILELHRIPHGRYNSPDVSKRQNTIRPAVLIIHGILSSSADYVLSGPGRAMAYVLAEEGYDVWIGNNRGNYYSRRHLILIPDKHISFWKFSFDEMGYFDLKSCTDYILDLTGNSKLHFIGHSEGGAKFLALTSLRPEYNDKVISFQGIAPSVYFKNTRCLFYITFAPMSGFLEPMAYLLGLPELLPRSKLVVWLGTNFCTDQSSFQTLCYILFGRNDDIRYYNTTKLPVYLGHNPAGASVRQVTHYSQIINTGIFRRYDYGFKQNLRRYKRFTPPPYNLSLVTAPIFLHYAVNDIDVDFRDIYLLGGKLPNLAGFYRVPRRTFHHMDFLWGVDAKEMVYDRMISLMKRAEVKINYTANIY